VLWEDFCDWLPLLFLNKDGNLRLEAFSRLGWDEENEEDDDGDTDDDDCLLPVDDERLSLLSLLLLLPTVSEVWDEDESTELAL